MTTGVDCGGSYSNNGKLLDSFIELPLRKLFIYGEDNKTLSYLPMLRVSDIKMAEIPLSNHFVFYDNPFQMYKAIMTFIVNDN